MDVKIQGLQHASAPFLDGALAPLPDWAFSAREPPNPEILVHPGSNRFLYVDVKRTHGL